MKEKIQAFLKRFSFRTGVIVIAMCVPFYILSFACLAVESFSPATKGVLWATFFGLAKAFQYGGLSIIGIDGVKRIKEWWKAKRNS